MIGLQHTTHHTSNDEVQREEERTQDITVPSGQVISMMLVTHQFLIQIVFWWFRFRQNFHVPFLTPFQVFITHLLSCFQIKFTSTDYRNTPLHDTSQRQTAHKQMQFSGGGGGGVEMSRYRKNLRS